MIKPLVFIGSSVDGLQIAGGIETNLEHDCTSHKWTNVFIPGNSNLGTLVKKLDEIDFAVFVFTPPDLIKMKGNEYLVVRDNVIFELGLFMGALGVERTFYIVPSDSYEINMHLPTDLDGIIKLTYLANEKNYKIKCSIACNEIRERIMRLGKKKSKLNEILEITGVDNWNTDIHFTDSVKEQLSNVKSHFSFMGMGFQKYLDESDLESSVAEILSLSKKRGSPPCRVLIANPFSNKLRDFSSSDDKLMAIQKRILSTLSDIYKFQNDEQYNIQVKFYPSEFNSKPTFRLFFANDDFAYISYYKTDDVGNNFPEVRIKSKREDNFFFPFLNLFNFLWDIGKNGDLNTLYQSLTTSQFSNKKIVENIQKNIELETGLNLRGGNESVCVAAVAGKDSMATIIKACKSEKYKLIIPVIISIPTEKDDFRIRIETLRHVKEYIFHERKNNPALAQVSSAILIEDDAEIWKNLNSDLIFLKNEYKLSSPCIGCHFYIHITRCIIALKLGVKNVISGDRENHSGTIKLNQTQPVLDAIIKFAKDKYDVTIKFPIRDIDNDDEVFNVIKDCKIPTSNIKDLKCVFSGKGSVMSNHDYEPDELARFVEKEVKPNFISLTNKTFF